MVAAQTPAPTPDIELQPILAHDKLERDKDLTLHVFISNKSTLPITVNDVTVVSETTQEKSRTFKLPINLPALSSTKAEITLHTLSDAKFGGQKIIVTANYVWGNQPQKTSKTVVLPLEISRKFEEEAKGFPGGTAAFLYLLLPVIPAILSFQIVEQLRKKEKLKMPEFETKHIAPAFLIAIVISFIMVVVSRSDAGVEYSNPTVFLKVLFASIIAGTGLSVLRWLWAAIQMKRWAFSKNDKGIDYLRKALLGPNAPETFVWVTGTSQGTTWEGFRLRQPNGDLVLGPQVMVTTEATAAFQENAVHDRKLLVRLVKNNKIEVQIKESVKPADHKQGNFAVVAGLELFQQNGSASKPFVTITT
ncbi:MAG TPA: hypothetical protein VE980_02950 [Pyrinomonadaceae bacterium]|nr:hypothetical protein [Pyrinomonadaceae bacterium]